MFVAPCTIHTSAMANRTYYVCEQDHDGNLNSVIVIGPSKEGSQYVVYHHTTSHDPSVAPKVSLVGKFKDAKSADAAARKEVVNR